MMLYMSDLTKLTILGGVVVFLIWLWISNLAILLGLELDAELDHQRALEEGVPSDVDMFSIPRDTRKFVRAMSLVIMACPVVAEGKNPP